MERLLFGLDLDPRRGWSTFRVMLPLIDDELCAIADDVAPYLR